MLYPRKGVSELTRFTPEEVEAKYGLTPAQYPDFAALRGDPSDNLPSIPSVGEKTAAKWIREYGSLDELVDQVDEVKGKVGEALREHLGSVLRNAPADRAGPRRRRWTSGSATSPRQAVGPRRGAPALRQPAVPGAARAAVRHPDHRRAGGSRGLRRRRCTGSAPGEVGDWLAEHARDGRRVGLSFARHLGPRHRRPELGDAGRRPTATAGLARRRPR